MIDIKKQKRSTKSILLAGVILFIVLTYYVVAMVQRNHLVRENRSYSLLISPKTVKFGGEKISGEIFSGMETARSEKDPELINEIKKVIAQKEMPSEIFKNKPSENTNIALTLNNTFRLENIEDLKILRAAAPKDAQWNITNQTLEQLDEILTRFEPKRLTIRNAINRPDTHFYFIFEHDEELGEIVDISAADYLEDYLLLEEYAIARALRGGQIEEALNSLVYIFRIAQLASEVAVPAVRSSAALIRLRAVDVMQTVILDEKFNKRYLNGLYGMILEQLKSWTPDRTVWAADRASGMKTYHRILQYGVEAALTPEEIEDLEQRGLLVFITRKQKKRKNNKTNNDNNTENYETKETILLKDNFFKTHIADEVFYLQSMQKIIDVCNKPFYQRISILDEINNEILLKIDKGQEPIIGVLLLRDIVRLMRLYAQDRAGCEIAFLAMSLSLEKPTIPALIANPFSEEKYKINQTKDDENPNKKFILVSSQGNHLPFRVPDYRTKTKKIE
ncbi:MAG: hypothetical protein LBE12_19540 [Planctomycetaceae bacterium]|jgi:hypothetical protein|nr:hypothetical protein [Planctomycetaceae bacterium]